MKGKARVLVQEDQVTQGRLGNWITIQLKHKEKIVVMINVYRLPTSSAQGPKYYLTQYNVVKGKVKKITEYQKEIFA